MSTTIPTTPGVHYPDSDGKPMADNTLQFEWIVTLKGNLDLFYRNDPNVFVAGDHLIYPVEGDSGVCQAPDVYVAFGRPKGHRGSYKVFEEGGIFPQVVFEVWSPGNRMQEMEDKRDFYEKHGAEEYYVVYPEFPAHVEGWRLADDRFVRIPDIRAWRSQRLGIRFELHKGQLAVYHPDGKRFLTYVELGVVAEDEHARAESEKQRADDETRRAEAEKQRADAAQQRAKAEEQRAEAEKQRAAKLADKLRELGIDPDAV